MNGNEVASACLRNLSLKSTLPLHLFFCRILSMFPNHDKKKEYQTIYKNVNEQHVPNWSAVFFEDIIYEGHIFK